MCVLQLSALQSVSDAFKRCKGAVVAMAAYPETAALLPPTQVGVDTAPASVVIAELESRPEDPTKSLEEVKKSAAAPSATVRAKKKIDNAMDHLKQARIVCKPT